MVRAGTTLTTVHLSHQQDSTTLTDDSANATNTWEDWGTETITIPNPGTNGTVKALVLGRFRDTVNTSTGCRSRVLISTDGGSTFDIGIGPWVQVGTSIPEYSIAAAQHLVTGTPSGDIVIKAQLFMQALDTETRQGVLTAEWVPQ